MIKLFENVLEQLDAISNWHSRNGLLLGTLPLYDVGLLSWHESPRCQTFPVGSCSAYVYYNYGLSRWLCNLLCSISTSVGLVLFLITWLHHMPQEADVCLGTVTGVCTISDWAILMLFFSLASDRSTYGSLLEKYYFFMHSVVQGSSRSSSSSSSSSRTVWLERKEEPGSGFHLTPRDTFWVLTRSRSSYCSLLQ